MKRIALALSLVLAAGTAAAQGKFQDGKAQQMSQEQRERMRQDMRDAYGKGGKGRQERMQQMSPEERQRLRHDIQDANKRLKR